MWLKEMRERTFKPHNSMTVAEADVPNERLDEYIGVLLDQSRKLRLRPFESIVLANYGGQL
ncbi:hypothetical protein EfmAA610_32180 (plasmid) [Enterococcus faecium]|nr:hypothetical protein EfmAA610_32180 [Enterococcus faecium]